MLEKLKFLTAGESHGKGLLGIIDGIPAGLEISEILNELTKFSPEIVENCKVCLRASRKDFDFIRLDKLSFSQCPEISIDIAIFEKTHKAYVLPLDCGWNDIGNWQSVWDISKKDANGNSIKGNVWV